MKLAENSSYILSGIKNTWDTNYHLYDIINDVEYLIDSEDIESELLDLEHIEELKELAWKII